MAESRPITIGEGLGSRVEVIEGLAEGDQVVVRGNERLRPGTRIRINGES
jgi:multidrug efflux pump subunit AcrA (membrane-fusion protein)